MYCLPEKTILDDMKIEYEVLLDANRFDIFGVHVDDRNYNHCILSITNAEGIKEDFDCWNSLAKPEECSAEQIRHMIGCVFDDALNALWEDWECLYGLEFSIAEVTANACRETLRKVNNLGIVDEDDILEVVNWARNYE